MFVRRIKTCVCHEQWQREPKAATLDLTAQRYLHHVAHETDAAERTSKISHVIFFLLGSANCYSCTVHNL